MSVYTVLNRALASAVAADEITPDEASIASLWLDSIEATTD